MPNTLSIDLISFQVSLFENDNERYLRFMVYSNVSRSVMEGAYDFLVAQKEITPIEDETKEAKAKLWDTAAEYTKGILDQDQRISYAKGLYALQTILKK